MMARAHHASKASHVASLLARGEQWLRPADQLDYLCRRWLIPIRYEASSPPRNASARTSGLLTELQAEIGRGLRAEYSIAQPIPARLADLLRQFERKTSASEGVA